MCDRVIADEFVVCKEHYKDYLKYRDDAWFKELAEMQRRQFEIDNEQNLISQNITYVYTTMKPRSKLTITDKNNIDALEKLGFGKRRIARKLNLNMSAVNMYMYRKKKMVYN